MAMELRYEAPLATFDMDEWNEFLDLQTTGGTISGELNDNIPPSDPRLTAGSSTTSGRCGPAVDAFDDESFSGSLEDLVNTFDERITKCFKNYNDHVESFAPVQVRTEEEVIASDSQTWWTLTGNFGNILPINWSAQNSSTTVSNNRNNDLTSDNEAFVETEDDDDDDSDSDSDNDDDDDDDDDSSHEMTVNTDEPVVTADEVISELEGMLEGSPTMLGKARGMRALSSSVSAELRQYAQSLLNSNGSPEEDAAGLSKLSLRALYELKS